MRREWNHWYVLILAGLLLSGTSVLADSPPTIEASYDFFKSPAGLSSEQNFAACPVPGLFFEEASTELLTGCGTFDGTIFLSGVPLVKFLGVTVGVVDTAVHRTEDLDFGDPTDDVTVTTDIELQALSLASTSPVEILCDQGMTSWDVTVEIDEDTGPSLGEMDVTLDFPDNLGGTASSFLDVCPRVTFIRTGPGESGSFELYPCDVGCEFNLLGETVWAYDPPPGSPGLNIPGLSADNFFFTEPLSAEEQLALQTLDEENCPCIFKYPHLSENHKHQACLPCPCDQDTEAPIVNEPPAATMECTNSGGSFPGDECIEKPGFVCREDWLADVDCLDSPDSTVPDPDCQEKPFQLTVCAAEDTNFLRAECGGFPNSVNFKGEDCCGNTTTEPSTLTITDTTAPVVTPGDDTIFTLAPPENPPNGDYVCFDRDDVEAEGLPIVDEVCFDYTWVFTGCTSNQPDNGTADGNTTDDCHICQGDDDDLAECDGYGEGEAFCARAERAGNDPAGRTYSIEVTATDTCDNVGDPAVIGNVFVPHQPPPPPAVCPVITYEGGRNNSFQSFDIAALLGITETVTVDSIFQDEPTDSDNRCPDGQGIGTGVAEVRAGRDGGGDSRFYHITYSVEGGLEVCPGNVLTVCIPHGGTADCADDSRDQGSLYDSTVCP